MNTPHWIRRSLLLVLLAFFCEFIRADEVEVFAAASLTNALKEIAANYEKSGGDHVVFNFEASGTLEVQIRHGAPADIFFSADEAKMNDLAKDGLMLAGSRKDLLENSLVIIVPTGSALTMTSATQLADPKIKKIALGETKIVPAGIYAKEYLTKIGIWTQVEPRVIPLENVRAALAAVETGNVDAGIVYKTDALHSKKVKIAYEVPIAEGPAIVYPAAVVQSSKQVLAAKKFLEYLSTPDVLKIFVKYGFVTKS
jgi:molybdate transport system substrate-binding protein